MKDLENFPKVKSQIERILSVRGKITQKKTANMERIKKLEETSKDSDAKMKEIKEKIGKLQEESKALINKESLTPDEEKKFGKIAIRIRNLNAEKSKLERSKTELEALRKEDKKYDGMISKCNMAWRMLLAGKSWDEIELATIEDVKKRQAKKEQEETKPEETKPEETKPEETKPEETKPEETKPEETKQEETPKTFAEKHPRLAKIPGLAKLVDRNAKKEDETKELTTTKFADKHPKLSKIPGLAKLADKIAERKQGKESTEETKPEETKPEETKKEETKPEETKPETESIKGQRDVFLHSLRVMTETEIHKEKGTYVTVEPKAKETEADKAPKEAKKEAEESER